MTDLHDRLTANQRIIEAATEGPWELRKGQGIGGARVYEPTGYPLPGCFNCGENDGVYEEEDATFIAASRTRWEQANRALLKVLEVHGRFELYDLEDACSDTSDYHRQERHVECTDDPGEYYCEDMPVGAVCDHCRDYDGSRMDWPCPTVRALTEKLTGEDDG